MTSKALHLYYASAKFGHVTMSTNPSKTLVSVPYMLMIDLYASLKATTSSLDKFFLEYLLLWQIELAVSHSLTSFNTDTCVKLIGIFGRHLQMHLLKVLFLIEDFILKTRWIVCLLAKYQNIKLFEQEKYHALLHQSSYFCWLHEWLAVMSASYTVISGNKNIYCTDSFVMIPFYFNCLYQDAKHTISASSPYTVWSHISVSKFHSNLI